MQTRVIAAISALFCLALCVNQGRAEEGRTHAQTELLQTGEPARVNNPDCTNDWSIRASNVIFKLGTTVIDRYIGVPVSATVLRFASENDRNWLAVRLGIHSGGSSCATQCVIYPKGVKIKEKKACIAETGGDGSTCADSDREVDWGRLENFSTSETPNAVVFCASAKNWSHNRNRWFTIWVIWDDNKRPTGR
jgi:hypothetical protein